jgi:predicted nicotinamide N-methyase
VTARATDLSELHGEDLVEALRQRFRTVVTDVPVGDHTFSILRPSNSDDLIREEDFVKDERLPYWADIWPASTILARHFIDLSKSTRIRNPGRGLELGCGVGLVTTAAMIAGYDMIASDYYTDALAFTRANAFRNTGRSPQAPMIDWRHFPDDMKDLDLILASDVLYEKEYALLLPGIFKKALAPGGMAIVADPGRVGVPEFLDECKSVGMVIRSKTTHAFEDGEIRQQIDLYEVADAKS